MEKLSGGSVCNHGHGQIVFRSSMALIIKLRTAFFSLCSLGKIDCVLKSFPFIHKGCIDYNTLQLKCKLLSQPSAATNKDVIAQSFQLPICAGSRIRAEKFARELWITVTMPHFHRALCATDVHTYSDTCNPQDWKCTTGIVEEIF